MGRTTDPAHRKAKPSAADLAAATTLRALWDARKGDLGLTQDDIAERLGGKTQGLVSQYLAGKIPLNYRALVVFADALGVEPTEIRSDLPEQQLIGSGGSSPGSQPARLDPTKIVATTRAINRILDRRVKGMTLDLTEQLDAELFAEVYAECDAMEEPTEADMVVVVIELMAAREKRRGSESEQVGSIDRGKGRKARSG